MLTVVITVFMGLKFLENVMPFHFPCFFELAYFFPNIFFIFYEVVLNFKIAKECSRFIAIETNQI